MRILIAMFLSLMLMAVLEFYSIAWLWRRIGGGYTVIIVLGTGIIGAIIARKNAKEALKQLMKGTPSGAGPAKQIFDAVAFFLAAALLIIPGVITDAAGLLLLLPMTRSVLYSKLIRNSEAGKQFSTGFNTSRHRSKNTLDSDSVIDVEAEEIED